MYTFPLINILNHNQYNPAINFADEFRVPTTNLETILKFLQEFDNHYLYE